MLFSLDLFLSNYITHIKESCWYLAGFVPCYFAESIHQAFSLLEGSLLSLSKGLCCLQVGMGWHHFLFVPTSLSCLAALAKTLSTRLRLSQSGDHELLCLVPGFPGRELSIVPFTKKLALGLPHKSSLYWCVLLLFLVSSGFGELRFVRGLFCISWSCDFCSWACVYIDHACIPRNKTFGHDILSFKCALEFRVQWFLLPIFASALIHSPDCFHRGVSFSH